MAKRPIGDLLAAIDVVELLGATVDRHDKVIGRILDKLAEIEARLDAPPAPPAP